MEQTNQKRFLDIYRTLLYCFGVIPEEAAGIANAYIWWFKYQFGELPSYGTVYLKDGKFYSMPYPSGPKKYFVGIEIDGTIYLAGYLRQVGFRQVETKLKKLKAKFSSLKEFDLRLPTRDEVKKLVEMKEPVSFYFRVKKLDEIKEFVLGCLPLYGDVWITPQRLEKTFVAVNDNSVRACRPSERTLANMYLVLRPDPQNFFKGEVDAYAKPTNETLKNYQLLKS